MPSDDLGPDEQRVQVRVADPVRDYLVERTSEEEATYSQLLEAWLPPADADPLVPVHDDEDAFWALKLTPDAHRRVRNQTNQWLRQGQVVAYYAMLDAIERGDAETAARFAAYCPTAVVAQETDPSTERGAGDDRGE
jgi:hypothetical protein